MDPAPIGSLEWAEIGELLTNLWIVVLLVVLFASSVLVGHNSIPSLVASRHIPVGWQKTRPLLYVLAVVFFGLGILFFMQVVDGTAVLGRFWPDYWI